MPPVIIERGQCRIVERQGWHRTWLDIPRQLQNTEVDTLIAALIEYREKRKAQHTWE